MGVREHHQLEAQAALTARFRTFWTERIWMKCHFQTLRIHLTLMSGSSWSLTALAVLSLILLMEVFFFSCCSAENIYKTVWTKWGELFRREQQPQERFNRCFRFHLIQILVIRRDKIWNLFLTQVSNNTHHNTHITYIYTHLSPSTPLPGLMWNVPLPSARHNIFNQPVKI